MVYQTSGRSRKKGTSGRLRQTRGVMKAMLERTPPISLDVIPHIEAAQDSPATGRLDTMHLIQDLELTKTLIYNEWIRYAVDDSNDISISGVIDSLKMENEPHLRFKLAELYYLEDSLATALTVLNNIPLYDSEIREYAALMKMKIQLAMDSGKTWLDASGGYLIKLWNIAGTETRAGVVARNVLQVLEDTVFAETLSEIIDSSGSSKRNDDRAIDEDETLSTKEMVKVYPNPAKDELIVEYKINAEYKYAEMIIYNIVGQEQVRFQLPDESGKIYVNISYIPKGVQFYCIISDKSIIHRGKVIIMR